MEETMSEDNKVIDDFTDEDKVQSDMNFWDYKNQKVIVGLFSGFVKDAYGEHAVIIGNENKEIHLPNLTALNGKLKRAEEGNKVKVVNLGEKKSDKTGRMYYDFDVFIKKE
jgi:hypothetical protein